MADGEAKVAGIVLAAGLSRRMGRTKALLPWGEACMLDRVIVNAAGSKLDPLIVVLGHDAERIREQVDLHRVNVVINHAYAAGQSTSLHAGLDAVGPDVDAALFLLGDQPFITTEIINTLITAFQSRQSCFVIPVYRGTRGNPVLVQRSVFGLLKNISGDRGARCLFDAMNEQIREVEVSSPAVLVDIDTLTEYRALQGLEDIPAEEVPFPGKLTPHDS